MKKGKKIIAKNVALCFSGQIKKFELCYPYIKKNLLDNIGSYDIFCCAEDDSDLGKIEMLNPFKLEKIKSSDVDKIIKEKNKELNKGNYKHYILPQSSKFNFRNIYQQLFKIKGAFNLLERHMKENNVNYNYFVRIRFDFLPLDIIKIEDFKLKKNKIAVPRIRLKDTEPRVQINDMFCIAKDFDTFRIYCSMYDNYEDIIQKEISLKANFMQKTYFLFEKCYNNFFLLLFNKPGKKYGKLPKNILGFALLFTKMFYREFKTRNRCNLEKAFFYLLKSEKKNIIEETINFVIVRDPMEGLLIFG
ncbi:MAG: hypothetical protein AABW50_00480 [Nanoarchaeota archaeon]